MAGADARIHIKLGHIEIEYEGDVAFLKKDLLETVRQMVELQAKHPELNRASESKSPPPRGGTYDHSTDTMANLLGGNKGPDLVMAAAAHLHFAKGKPKFTRHEIIREMQSASGHYKKSYPNNLTTYLNSLKGKDRLRQGSDGTFSLSHKEQQAVETKLANN